MDLCNPQGSITRSIFSRSNIINVPTLYTALRKSTWGGLFPANISDETTNSDERSLLTNRLPKKSAFDHSFIKETISTIDDDSDSTDKNNKSNKFTKISNSKNEIIKNNKFATKKTITFNNEKEIDKEDFDDNIMNQTPIKESSLSKTLELLKKKRQLQQNEQSQATIVIAEQKIEIKPLNSKQKTLEKLRLQRIQRNNSENNINDD